MRKSFPAFAVASFTCSKEAWHRNKYLNQVFTLSSESSFGWNRLQTLTVTYEDSAKFPFRMMSSETVPCSSQCEDSDWDSSTEDQLNSSLERGYQTVWRRHCSFKVQSKIHALKVVLTRERAQSSPRDPTLWIPSCLRETPDPDWWCRQ